MREVQNVEIDGHMYLIGDWPVDKANGYFVWIVKTLGEGVAGLLGDDITGLKDILETELANGKLLQQFIAGLTDKIEEGDVIRRSRQITEGLICDNVPIEYNTHFQGRLFHLYKVMFYVLKAQYSDFLGAGQGALKSLAPQK